MPKFTPLPTIGAGDLNSVTEFLGYLKDPDKYKERLDALEARRKEINSLIETVGKVKEIEKLRSQAISKHEQATKMMEDAAELRKKADEKIKEDLESSRVAAQKRIDEANGLFGNRERDLRNGERELAKNQEIYRKENQQLTAREDRAKEATLKAEAALQRYHAATRSLREAIEETAKAL
jgi:uncharacterized coiled-coil DUF342 family protein